MAKKKRLSGITIKEPQPEKVLFQVIYERYNARNVFVRHGDPIEDKIKAEDTAISLFSTNYDVINVFVVRVEAAFIRETTVKRAI